MSLKEYKAKRDFRHTAEPAGRARASRRERFPAFVIQKHDASHLHYDFRLEMDGVLKSWAVPKGFPVKRGDRRLAIEVEDHPIEYGSFEGTILEGNYGAGTVMLWDHGTYAVSGDDPLQALKAGKIHFTLEGKKLKGEWTLVRMRQFAGTKPQWLLLKSGSNLPPLTVRAEDRSALSGRSMEQIAGNRQAKEWKSNRAVTPTRAKRPRPTRNSLPASRVSLTRTRSNRASNPRLVVSQGSKRRKRRTGSEGNGNDPRFHLERLPARSPEFVEPMKALLVGALPKGPQWIYEIKFDGVRALAIKDGQSIKLLSRAGNDLAKKYPEVVEGLKALPAKQVVFDGEVVAVDSQGRSAFQLLQTYQNAGHAKPPLFYYVFDALQFEGRDLKGLPLWQRKALAQLLIEGISGPVRFSESIQADSQIVLKEMQARGLEGLVAKKTDSPYEPGRRSGAWAKFKWTNEQEFVIGGYTRPKGARSHFGAILVGYYEKDRLLFAAKVGTGFNEKMLRSLFSKFEKLVQPDCPFANLPERISGSTAGLSVAEMKRCTWVRPKLVCQIRFAEWTRDRHLRQPAFLGLREDKDPRDVTREQPA